MQQPVTVITAPAGYGKTVLVDQWAAEHDGPTVTRLALKSDDRWPRVAARLDAALPASGETILVIDDVDAPADEELARELSALVERAPTSLHLVLVSRSRAEPVFEGLHGRRDVAFLTAADLAFTRAEARALVKAVSSQPLSGQPLDRLMARTEGWAVGLEVAAIDLRDAPDVEGSIEALAGDERHIAAFLFDEVLAQEAPSIRGFLAQTSVLDQLSGSLCDAVTGRDDGTITLRRLEHSGVFLRRVRGNRDSFVCHGLLRDLLRRELRRGDFEDEAVLLTRAATWYAAHDDAPAAARYYTEAEAWDALVELCDVFGPRIIEGGRAADALAWLNAVPTTHAGDGRVPLRRAYLHTILGENRQAAQIVHDFEIGDRTRGERAAAEALRATGAFFDASPDGAIRAADQALRAMQDMAPEELPNILGVTSPTTLAIMAGTSRARAVWYLGDVAASRRALAAGIAHGDAYEPWLVRTMSALALLEAWAGNLRAARSYASRVPVAGSAGLLQYPAVLDARLALAHVCRARGHQRRAADLLDEAETMTAGSRWPVTGAILAVERGLWHLAAGQPEQGLAALDHHRTLSHSPPPPLVDAYLLAAEARLLLSLGDVDRAESVADNEAMQLLCPELAAAAVQVAVARRDLDTAAARLDAWNLDDAQPRQGLQHRLWTAVVELEVGDRRRAVNAVSGVVVAAEREGDLRLFLDGGRPVERVLRALLHARPQPHAERILQAAQRAQAASHGDALGLSRRELEVARYLPTPLSSAEIAGRLYISLNTLKTHLRTIYCKLGATNRREAIQRAEELGIA